MGLGNPPGQLLTIQWLSVAPPNQRIFPQLMGHGREPAGSSRNRRLLPRMRDLQSHLTGRNKSRGPFQDPSGNELERLGAGGPSLGAMKTVGLLHLGHLKEFLKNASKII